MTEDTIRLITAAVRDDLRPSLERIHERIDSLSAQTAAINERTQHMPTTAELGAAISAHTDQCRRRRRWVIGLLLSLPAVAAAIIGILATLPS